MGEGLDHGQGLPLRDGQGDRPACPGLQRANRQILCPPLDKQLGNDGNAQSLLHHGQNGVVVLGGKFDVRAHPRIVQRPVDVMG